MITLTKIYPNGFERTLQVLDVALSGDTADAAIITTADDGDMAISLSDTPDLWQQLISQMPEA